MRKKMSSMETSFEDERKRFLSIIKDLEDTITEHNDYTRKINNENSDYKKEKEDLQREIEVLKEHSGGPGVSQHESMIAISNLKTQIEVRDNKIKSLDEQIIKDKKINSEIIEKIRVSYLNNYIGRKK